MEKVPAFLSPWPTAVEEDTGPYVVQWGLLNKDTVVGDSRAAAEWSKNVVTSRDRAYVVESSEDLQIELLGAQAVATVSRTSICFLISEDSLLRNFSLLIMLSLCRLTPTSRLPSTT